MHEVYEREAPEVWDENREGPTRTEDVPCRTADIEGLGLLGPVVGRTFGWGRAYDAAGYMRILDPYSGQLLRTDGFGGRDKGAPTLKTSRLIEERQGGRDVKAD